jgi:hypothetical protein
MRYGDRPNSQLLQYAGFVCEPNPFDTVSVSVVMPADDFAKLRCVRGYCAWPDKLLSLIEARLRVLQRVGVSKPRCEAKLAKWQRVQRRHPCRWITVTHSDELNASRVLCEQRRAAVCASNGP